MRELGDLGAEVDAEAAEARWLPFAGLRWMVQRSSGRSRWKEGWWNSRDDEDESLEGEAPDEGWSTLGLSTRASRLLSRSGWVRR